MCIYDAEKINIKKGEGYVCLIPNDDGRLQSIFGQDAYHKSKWYKAKDMSLVPDNQRSDVYYTPGFHICTTIEDARHYQSKGSMLAAKFSIFKVKYKHAYLKGYTLGVQTIVAKERMILECIK